MFDLTVPSGATISECKRYRYTLWRSPGDLFAERGVCTFVMLNPSTADASVDDPTLRRCAGFAKRWGFRQLLVTNLFAMRSKHPSDIERAVKRGVDPVGPENDKAIALAARVSDLIVCAWGNDGLLMGRAATVATDLVATGHRLHYLRMTDSKQPWHPLYLASDTEPQLWR